MDTTFILEMTSDDYDQMIDLWKRTPGIGLSEADSKENIYRFLSRNKALSFVCEIQKEHRIVGTILCGHDSRRGYIYHLAVDDAYRKLGIGKELTARSIEQLRFLGVSKCPLFVYTDNEPALKFYEGTGWTKRKAPEIFSKDI